MNIKVTPQIDELYECDGLVFLCQEGEKNNLSRSLCNLPPQLKTAVEDFAAKRSDWGKKGKCYEFHTHKSLLAEYLLFVGVGKAADGNALRHAGAVAGRHANTLNLQSLAVFLADEGKEKVAVTFVEGILSGVYSFARYQSEHKAKSLNTVKFFSTAEEAPKISKSILEIVTTIEGVYLARDLVSTPSNDMTPQHLAEQALLLADANLKVRILGPQEILSQGMNALYSVAKGSLNEPRLIIMEYQGTEDQKTSVALVGKGLTFDSGGISLKPSENMGEMKSDMAGAAAVMATIANIAKLKLKQNVVGIIPALENMPDGNSYKPGDVLQSLAKISIEITNTDAEGRVALADALAYARSYNPRLIIDIATLTGACSIAVGRELIAMMGNAEGHKKKLEKISHEVGEPVWELPLWEGYRELLKSDIADLINSAGREAGTITAGLFLERFVGDFPWIHLDIASTAWTSKNKDFLPKGATGVGVKLLTSFIKKMEEAS
ncbi:MAG: leucyl aminopeptidase [Deltaproteobacteria bacterium]|nr:leucyl aminopeptidase [Deltaproteobacteria bacterium]